MSNHVALLSSSIATNSSFLAFAHTSSTYPCYSTYQDPSVLEFHPTNTPDAYKVGELLGKMVKRNLLVTGIGNLVAGARNVASYFWSIMPTLTIPGASASPAGVYTSASPVCITPGGSYKESCYETVVSYDNLKDLCKLTTICPTMYAGLSPINVTYYYPPTNSKLILANNNGSVIVDYTREESVISQLNELSNTVVSSEALERSQEAIIETLQAGDVITVNGDLQLAVIHPNEWKNHDEGFRAFQQYAKDTGGIMGYSPSDAHLNSLLVKMSAHILKTAESYEFIDIAFVFDTTGSMGPNLTQIKHNIVQFLKELQKKKQENASTCRIALMEYRDKDKASGFLKRTVSDFTPDLDLLQTKVMNLVAEGGGDESEAALDALFAAQQNLSWKPNTKNIVILISDAPPHPKTQDGLSAKAVLANYQATGTQIAVYPIFAKPNKS